MAFIYRITNKINGKKYIGQTTCKDPLERWKGHQKAIRQGKGCPFLRKAVVKYGIENFQFEVIHTCLDEQRDEKEKEFIMSENSLIPHGYNMAMGGQGGGFIGKKHSPESKEKISQASIKAQKLMSAEMKESISKKLSEKMKIIKKDVSEETCKKISEKRKGRLLSESHKQKISHSLKGRTLMSNSDKSLETRRKISEGAKKRVAEGRVAKFTDEMKVNHSQIMTQVCGIKLDKFSSDGDFIQTYNSLKTAAKGNGTTEKTIRKVLKGEIDKAGGFIWKHHDESPKLEIVAKENLHTL
jgi:group I intron endonuclease